MAVIKNTENGTKQRSIQNEALLNQLNLSASDLLNLLPNDVKMEMSYMLDNMMMKKRKEILEKHEKSIWYAANRKQWCIHIPDETKPGGRRIVGRKKKAELEDYIYRFYVSQEEAKDPSIKELYYEFMNYKKTLVSPCTIKRMAADWKSFYEPDYAFISIRLSRLTSIDIDNFFNSILAANNKKRKALYNISGVLKQMLEYAVDSNYIEKNPYRLRVNKRNVLPDRKKDSETEVYSKEEEEAIKAEMIRRHKNNPSSTTPLAVLLHFELGCRVAETMALKASDQTGNTVHIQRQLLESFDCSDVNNIISLGYEAKEYTKTEAGNRYIPLTDRAKELIEQIKETNRIYGHQCEDFLFVREGHLLSPDTFAAQLLRGCKYAGIPLKTSHKIRKTYASKLNASQVPLPRISKVLGHADEHTTMRYYVYDRGSQDEAYADILEAIEGSDMEQCNQCNQKIIYFPATKKPGSLVK